MSEVKIDMATAGSVTLPEPGTVTFWDGEREYTIKPCPFCGNTARVWDMFSVCSNLASYVACDTCGSRSAAYTNRAEAIEHWNERYKA